MNTKSKLCINPTTTTWVSLQPPFRKKSRGLEKHQDITLFLPAKNSSPALLQASSTKNREHRTVGTAAGKLGGNQTCLKPSRMSRPGWLHLVTTHSGLRSHTDHPKHLGGLGVLGCNCTSTWQVEARLSGIQGYHNLATSKFEDNWVSWATIS